MHHTSQAQTVTVVRTAADRPSTASPIDHVPTMPTAGTSTEGEDERFDVGNSYVTDMRHRVAPADAELPAAFWRIVAYEARIVEAGSAWGHADTLESAIRCRRKPRSKACPGHLRVRADDGVILWACTRCRDQGRISAWQGLQWDFSSAAGWYSPGRLLGCLSALAFLSHWGSPPAL